MQLTFSIGAGVGGLGHALVGVLLALGIECGGGLVTQCLGTGAQGLDLLALAVVLVGVGYLGGGCLGRRGCTGSPLTGQPTTKLGGLGLILELKARHGATDLVRGIPAAQLFGVRVDLVIGVAVNPVAHLHHKEVFPALGVLGFDNVAAGGRGHGGGSLHLAGLIPLVQIAGGDQILIAGALLRGQLVQRAVFQEGLELLKGLRVAQRLLGGGQLGIALGHVRPLLVDELLIPLRGEAIQRLGYSLFDTLSGAADGIGLADGIAITIGSPAQITDQLVVCGLDHDGLFVIFVAGSIEAAHLIKQILLGFLFQLSPQGGGVIQSGTAHRLKFRKLHLAREQATLRGVVIRCALGAAPVVGWLDLLRLGSRPRGIAVAAHLHVNAKAQAFLTNLASTFIGYSSPSAAAAIAVELARA